MSGGDPFEVAILRMATAEKQARKQTEALVGVLRSTLQMVMDDAEDLYKLRWIDMRLMHITHSKELPRKFSMRYPVNVRDIHQARDAPSRARILELCLRQLQLLGWHVHSIQDVLPGIEPRIEVDWVFTPKAATPTTAP